MVPEAPLEQTEHGTVARGDGWYVLNARDAAWYDRGPRGAAHAWAAHGHIREAQDRLDEQAREHARVSNPNPE